MGEYYLMHAGRSKRDGAKVGSGRYPLGSGDRPYQATGGKPRSKKSRNRPNFDHLSDEQMQNAIRRENLENTYAKTFDLNYDFDKKAESYGKIAKDSIKAAKRIEQATRKKNPPMDLSGMSDEDLRRRINRVNLERQYNDLFNSDISKGRKRTQKFLEAADIAVDILAPLAALGIAYLGYKKVTSGKGLDLFPWK